MNMSQPDVSIRQMSKRFSLDEQVFIKSEVARLLDGGIIRKSYSSWRSQVEVIKNPFDWKLAINYSQTINKRFQDGVVDMDGIDKTLEGLKNYKFFARLNFRDWH